MISMISMGPWRNCFRTAPLRAQEIVDDLDDFYGAVAQLFQDGAIAGLKIIAR